MEELARFALRLADAARAETLPRFAAGAAADNKAARGGYDPVTAADREAERAMRRLIEAACPDDGILGEEFGERPSRSGRVWSLDPVDGTRAFICGLPSWTTLIACLDGGQPVLGLIDAPRLDERYLADKDGARLLGPGGERPLRTSGCRSLAEARLSTTDPGLFGGREAEAWSRVRTEARLTRYGLDAYGYARLAAGTVDLVIESGLKPWDVHALVPVVHGAGGVVGNWAGGDDLSAGALVAAATPELFEEAVTRLRVTP